MTSSSNRSSSLTGGQCGECELRKSGIYYRDTYKVSSLPMEMFECPLKTKSICLHVILQQNDMQMQM